MKTILCAIVLLPFALAEDAVTLRDGTWTVKVTPSNLAVEATRSDGNVEVVANFGATAADYRRTRIPPRSVLVQGQIYTPRTK